MSFEIIAADGLTFEVHLSRMHRHFLFYYSKAGIMFVSVEWRNRYLYG